MPCTARRTQGGRFGERITPRGVLVFICTGPLMVVAVSLDLVLAREVASEHQASERDPKWERDRAEAKEHFDDKGPKEVGRGDVREETCSKRE